MVVMQFGTISIRKNKIIIIIRSQGLKTKRQ